MMHLADTPKRFGEHKNAFGFLRLLFASLVIFSHVPGIVDFGARRELLYNLTGTTTLGSFAVWGFFVISGYLITSSITNSSSIRSYMIKRVARIYPGFIAASLVCLLVVVPLSGGTWAGGPVTAAILGIVRMAILARPVADDPFPGQNFNDYASGLNGAMWTIQYEFACYLMVLALFVFGVLRRPALVPLLSVLLISVGTFAADLLPSDLSRGSLFPGAPNQLFLLPGIFLAGSSFYLFRAKVRFTAPLTALAVVGLIVSLLNSHTAAFGYVTFGSYLIFATAKAGAGTWVGKINDKTDISYGVYLYAWPAEQLLIRYVGTESLTVLGVLTWAIAAVSYWLSWQLIESPFLNLIRSRYLVKDKVAPA